MKRSGILLAAALFIVMGAGPARAEITITPFIGSLFSGDLPDSKADYGASATFMGGGIFGAKCSLITLRTSCPQRPRRIRWRKPD